MSRTRKHKLTGAKAVSHQCENHGACEWCRRNRTYNELRDKEKAEYDEKPIKRNNFSYEGTQKTERELGSKSKTRNRERRLSTRTS